VWVHSTVVPPGNKKSVFTFSCQLTDLRMEALLNYAQGVFEFPDGKFTITPAKKKGTGAPAESKEEMEELALIIDSDQQLQRYLNTLPVDDKQAIYFRFAVVLGQSVQQRIGRALAYTKCFASAHPASLSVCIL